MSTRTIQPGWFSIPGACRYTGFSEPSIRAAISRGLLTAREVTISGKGDKPSVRLKREEIDAWIEGGTPAVEGGGQ